MKTLKQIQEENRKFIITACNPEAKTYEEALEMELSFGCVVMDILHSFFGNSDPTPMTLIEDTGDDSFYFTHYRANPVLEFQKEEILDKSRFEIIGKPLTLNRVLIALSKVGYLNVKQTLDVTILSINGFYWDLTEETLERQSEETQRAVHKLNTK